MPNSGLTEFVQAMPDQYKKEDVVGAYRNYYKGEKASIAKWKDGCMPYWWRDEGTFRETKETKERST
jgi:hypothetical protein